MTDFTEYDATLFAQVDLGEKTREFLATDIGRYLVGCAEQQITSCSQDLLNVNPNNTDKISEIQSKARTASNFIVWVNEAIDMGDSAYQQIKQFEE